LSNLIFNLVQARPIDKIESGIETAMSEEENDKPSFFEKYSKLLTYLKNQETNIDNDDSNDLSSSSTEDVKQSSKRAFSLFPNRRSSQRYRPIYTYGRKSHWDTFFG
jgi:hypothetical protein